jgi:hypothetical protein
MLVKDYPKLFTEAREGVEHYVGASGAADVDALYLPEAMIKVARFPIVFRKRAGPA